MFNIGGGELALILVAALLILGPKRLPELARGLGKFMREFKRQTDQVRSVVEREFYKMDEEINPDAPKAIAPGLGVAQGQPDALPPPSEVMPSQLTAPMDTHHLVSPVDESDPSHPDYNKPDQPGAPPQLVEAAPPAAAPVAAAPPVAEVPATPAAPAAAPDEKAKAS